MARLDSSYLPRSVPCAQCGKPIPRPDWVESSPGRTSFLWFCRACDYRFEAIAILTLEDGSKMTCRVIDMSLSGAAIAAEHRPPLKSQVSLGRVQARVVRNLEEGFALEFVHEQDPDSLEDNVTAR